MKTVGRQMGSKEVTVIHAPDTDSESRITVTAVTQADKGFFDVTTPIYEGDIVEEPDPRGGTMRRLVNEVKIHPAPPEVAHISVTWGKAPPPRIAPIRRLTFDGLHEAVQAAAGDLFADGHYEAAVQEAFKSLDLRVKAMTGLTSSGTALMGEAFAGKPPRLDVSTEQGQSGLDEIEGFHFIFRGTMLGVRNPGAHELFGDDQDPGIALEYLGFASLLHRRLDVAQRKLDAI